MYDTIIVGGGPAGLTASIYLARACKKVLVIEQEVFGGQITKAHKVENYPGFKEISGLELGTSFYEQASSLGVETNYGSVTKIEKNADFFQVFKNDEVLQSKTIIFATGASPRKLGLKEEEHFIGRGISYCATCDGSFFKDKDVCVVGGGNTAIDDALYLANLCKKVYLVHRRDTFRAEEVKVNQLKNCKNVEIIYSGVVTEILGESVVEGVIVEQKSKKNTISVSGLFIAIGRKPNTDCIKEFVSLNSNGYVVADENLVPGFFIAGDVREKMVRQLTTATSDGTVAAMECLEYLEKTKEI